MGCTQKNSSIVDQVNPFLGTAPLVDSQEIGYKPPEGWRVWAGLVFPGSSLPNAMVQLSPVTEFGTGAGYQYEDEKILAFTHTNKGHWNYCNIPVIPEVGLPNRKSVGAQFSHEHESASPGSYSVLLKDNDIQVKLTSTKRCGFHQYEYSSGDSAMVVFDLGKSNERVDQLKITEVGKNQIKGYQRNGSRRVYFYAEFSRPFIASYKMAKDEWIDFNGSLTSKSGDPLVAFQFDTEQSSSVKMKIGLSYVNTEQASNNLQKEIPGWSYEQVHSQARHKWESLLSNIKIEGGSEKERMIFYTSFYRAFLWPALRSDVDGTYRDARGNASKADFNYYTVPSLWDTFRNKLVLLSFLKPELSGDIIQSLVDRGNKSGYMPTFFHGDHAAAFIAGAYLRGVDNFDVAEAYQLLVKNANDPEGPREHLNEYLSKGYIPTPRIENPDVGTEANGGVTKTLEYAYDDYSIALFAKEIGKSRDVEKYMKRAGYYKNVFDTTTNFMRGRYDDGGWVTPFNPKRPHYTYMYREANGWQSTFFVPHDVNGLIELFGGPKPYERKLDSLFSIPWNPNHIARNVCTFIGQYCHGNQPDHQVPYMYHFIGKPGKSQHYINQIHDLYGIGMDDLALPGMDDTGEMSSWYVFSAIGMYPFSPSDTDYLLSTPIFDKVKINLPNDNTFIINSHSREEGEFLRNIELNETPVDDYSISHDEIMKGGKMNMYPADK